MKPKVRRTEHDLEALPRSVCEGELVLWGWNPGGERAPVSVPHAVLVKKFEAWAAAGGPCPAATVADTGTK